MQLLFLVTYMLSASIINCKTQFDGKFSICSHCLYFQCPQSELDAETVKSILAEYKIHNADVTLRSDATADDLIDVVEGNRYC